MPQITIKERQAKEEEYYFGQFLSLNNDLRNPEISIPNDPATPDSLIIMGGKCIGIDLTKYYIDIKESSTGGSSIQKEENDFEKLVREAQRRFELKHTQRLYVVFRKDHNFHFPEGQTRRLREELIDRILVMVESMYKSS